MQDTISTLPTTDDAPIPKNIETIQNIFKIDDSSGSVISVQVLLYITILYFVISSSPIEDMLTRYIEFTANSTIALNVARSILFFGIAYLLFTYLIK